MRALVMKDVQHWCQSATEITVPDLVCWTVTPFTDKEDDFLKVKLVTRVFMRRSTLPLDDKISSVK